MSVKHTEGSKLTFPISELQVLLTSPDTTDFSVPLIFVTF